jgi:methyltransferase (TIGR00027 family)
MKYGQPSQTASLVTLLRAIGDLGLTHVPNFHDPTARKMLPPAWARWLARIEKRAERGGRSALLEAARHAADLLALRTLVIDAYLRDALARGARQLVILGAGLDGRAYRLAELASVRVFEVDHPSTQTYKMNRSAELSLRAESVTFVAVDFERDALDTKLAAACHRADVSTVWIWEGVVMYLTDHALRGTLRVIASMSASDSTLIVNYHTRRRSLFMNLVLRLWSEPQIGARAPQGMAAEISAAGFRVTDDTSGLEWAARFGAPPVNFDAAGSPRVLTACR